MPARAQLQIYRPTTSVAPPVQTTDRLQGQLKSRRRPWSNASATAAVGAPADPAAHSCTAVGRPPSCRSLLDSAAARQSRRSSGWCDVVKLQGKAGKATESSCASQMATAWLRPCTPLAVKSQSRAQTPTYRGCEDGHTSTSRGAFRTRKRGRPAASVASAVIEASSAQRTWYKLSTVSHGRAVSRPDAQRLLPGHHSM